MIHYTLLPQEEIKSLRHEYRVRFFIILIFFVSCGIILGIFSLIPSSLLSYAQEMQVSEKTSALQKIRKESGVEVVEKDLVESQRIADRMVKDRNTIAYFDSIQKIAMHRPASLFISSFEITHERATSSPYLAVIQGKAATRESLLAFKSALEQDVSFEAIDLPLSDLAKSKDVSFALKLKIK